MNLSRCRRCGQQIVYGPEEAELVAAYATDLAAFGESVVPIEDCGDAPFGSLLSDCSIVAELASQLLGSPVWVEVTAGPGIRLTLGEGRG